MFKQISLRLGDKLADVTNHESCVIAYGIEVVLRAAFKLAIIISLAAFLNLYKATIVILCASAVFRLVSGGAHCSSYFKCLITSLLVMLGLAYVTEMLFPYVVHKEVLIFLCIGWFTTVIIIIIWAPVGNVNRPLVDAKQRIKFKWLSLIYTSFCFGGATIYVVAISKEQGLNLICSMSVGLLWQAFTLTPYGNKFLTVFDTLLTFGKEVPSHA